MMRVPSVPVRHSSSPDLREEDPNNANSSNLALWLNRLGTEEDSSLDVDLDESIEEDAIRFLELPVEQTGGRRRRLLAQFCENTKNLDAWLRRADQQMLGEPSDASEQTSSSQGRPNSGPRLRMVRQMVIRGSVRKGYGIRKPRSHEAVLSEELHLSREEDEMMMQWESKWREQELEHAREEAQGEGPGLWCRTPSFGAEAASPSSEQDPFAEEIKAICGSFEPTGAPPEAKHRVTLACQPIIVCEEDADEQMHARSREERLMRFCPEVVNPAFSQEVKAVLQKSLVRGASKVLAEHRGHRFNWERFRRAENEERGTKGSEQRALRLALHLHERSQQRYRRGCPATPPLQGVISRPGSVARQSPDFNQMRQALPSESAFVARNKKRKKAARQALERPGSREKPNRAASRLYEPVLCSFECSNWRAPSPMQLRLEEEQLVVGSQWRDFLEELRFNRCQGGSKKKAKPIRVQQTQEFEQEESRSKESLESGKVHDCPDAHAYHLVHQNRLEALERWGGLQYVRPSMLRQLLFYVARQGSVQMMQWLLANMRKNHPDALHWREQGGETSLLHAAAEADMLTMCVFLEDLGADCEATDQHGHQPWEVAGPFCKEAFKNYGCFRGDDQSPLNSTLLTGTLRTATLQTISEKPMSRSATLRLSQSGR